MSVTTSSVFLALALATALVGCKGDARNRAPADSPAESSASTAPTKAAADQAPAAEPAPCPDLADAPSTLPAPERLVAIGDIHGDIDALREVLTLIGAIDSEDDWAGGALVIVQTGDLLDRGDTERAILDWLARLRPQAQAAGGDLLLLNGNHELMNARWDFRYVTEGGFREFADVSAPAESQSSASGAADDAEIRGILADAPAPMRGRAHAFRPGGPYAKQLAEGNVVQQVGDTIFAHGGVTAHYAEYGLDRINRELRCWLADSRASPRRMPKPGRDNEGPVWTRRFSLDPPDCADLEKALATLGAKRMVVGHTVQAGGITSACDGKIWRIDTGIAAYYGGPRQALEIRGQTVTPLGVSPAASPAAQGDKP